MKLLSLGLKVETDFFKPTCLNLTANTPSSEDISIIRENLEQVCRTLSLTSEGFLLKIDEVFKRDYVFLECHVTEGQLSFKNYERLKEVLKNSVSSILSDFIVSRLEETIIRKIIKNDYTYFSHAENEILTTNILAQLDKVSHKNSDFTPEKRRQIIKEELAEYLDASHELVLEGFISFRLKEYQQKLAQVIEAKVDDFLAEQEYKEFLRVLKYFVETQPPRVEELHVMIEETEEGNRNFKVPDTEGETAPFKYLETTMAKCHSSKTAIELKSRPGETNCEEALINVLITIAPNNIIIHSNNVLRDEKIIETINSIFADRVTICSSCDICRFEVSSKNAKKEPVDFFQKKEV